LSWIRSLKTPILCASIFLPPCFRITNFNNLFSEFRKCNFQREGEADLLHVSLFGGFNIELEGTDERKGLTQTTQSLLVYLLLFRHKTHSREILAATFWREYPQARARNCLNTALWRLRRYLEPKGTPPGTYLISSPAGELGFNLQCGYWLDVDVFEKQIVSLQYIPAEKIQEEDITRLESAIQLYSGDLLEGYYYDWVLRERERLRDCYLDCLYYLMYYFTAQDSVSKAASYGQEILSNDPLREDVHRHLMRLYMKNGQRCLALRQYDRCRQVLAKELKVPPMDETQDLCRRITGHEAMGEEKHPASAELQQALEKLHWAVRCMNHAQRKFQRLMEH
jgi:DNA-binding SARP family transcriptional activator